MSDVVRAIAALQGGGLVVLPTDTVYGLACEPSTAERVERLYALKGRAAVQPTALVAASVEALDDCVPELAGIAAVRALLPGPFTLVLPNPAGRYPWLNAARPETLGVRVPALTGPAADVLAAVGAVAATSANLPGGPDPRAVGEVPAEIAAGVAVVVDGGELPGIPSTVVDLTGAEPVVLREGAVPAADVLARLGHPAPGR